MIQRLIPRLPSIARISRANIWQAHTHTHKQTVAVRSRSWTLTRISVDSIAYSSSAVAPISSTYSSRRSNEQSAQLQLYLSPSSSSSWPPSPPRRRRRRLTVQLNSRAGTMDARRRSSSSSRSLERASTPAPCCIAAGCSPAIQSCRGITSNRMLITGRASV